MTVYKLLLCITCLLVAINANDNPDIDDKIYRTLGGVYPCFRLTNATHQIGCSASSTQTRGVVHVVNRLEDIDWLIDHGDNGAYIVAMEDNMFNRDTIMRLMNRNARVDGIIVKHDTTNLTGPLPEGGFSPESTCPNSLFGLGSDATCASDPTGDWNPKGNSLTYTDFGDFPIFAVTAYVYDAIVACYNKHNRHDDVNKQSYPLCSLEMRADMFVVRDTETCMRRSKLLLHQISGRNSICDPLGDYNVWTMPQGIPRDLSDRKVILVATKLDSTAFFRDLSFGANNDAAAITVMLAVMDTIGCLIRGGLVDYKDATTSLMFVFFQGESWDYIGSSRMVYDITNDGLLRSSAGREHKIRMENIDAIVELSHVGIQEDVMSKKGMFYIHGNYGHAGSKASHMLDVMRSYADNVTIDIRNSSSSWLPPSSAQSFLKENSSISSIIIGDYDTQYNNMYYGSRFDNIRNLKNLELNEDNTTIANDSILVLQLKSLTEVITNTLLNLSGQSVDVSMVNTSTDFVAESLYCFLYHSNCSLFKSVLLPSDASNLRPRPYNRYVTISTITNAVTIQVWHLMSYLLAWQQNTTTRADCDAMNKDHVSSDIWRLYWVRGGNFNESCSDHCLGTCYNSSRVEYHFAESPAFALEDYRSVRYSTWAESTWSTVLLRMYLVTSIEEQLAILIGGMLIQLLSIYVSIMCWRRGRELFTIATVESHDL